MYPGGAEQRARDIEAGAGRPAVELCADVVEEAAKLEARWLGASEEMWAHGKGRSARGDVRLSETVFARWREVEVHHTDLGLGYTFDDWPADYVREDLVRQQMAWRGAHGAVDAELPPRALAERPALRLAWLLGRAHIEGLQDVHY
jgi:maleylpyruvate isomerase